MALLPQHSFTPDPSIDFNFNLDFSVDLDRYNFVNPPLDHITHTNSFAHPVHPGGHDVNPGSWPVHPAFREMPFFPLLPEQPWTASLRSTNTTIYAFEDLGYIPSQAWIESPGLFGKSSKLFIPVLICSLSS
jgi:hypothetical protein